MYPLKELQNFLNQNEIPKIKGKPKTFLGIAKQPHYENVLSNIYAFYFNVNEVHKFEDLFVNSLLELIDPKKEKIHTFSNFNVFTEFSISKQRRIDILLKNNEQAIIIENKVYHHLNNDLSAYYKEVKADTKVGVVFSLHPISNIKPSYFVNITHLELLQQVYKNIGEYIIKGSNKYGVFLNDFYQNVINLTQPLMDENSFNFYFENKEKINNLITYKASAREFIENEVRKAHSKLEEENIKVKLYESSGNLGNALTYYISELNRNLMFTIIYGDLLKVDGTLKIIIELKGAALNNKERYKGITLSGTENTRFYNDKSKSYAHFEIRSYKLEQFEIRDLGNFIFNKLKNDGFLDVFNKIDRGQ
jgi:hypothetical protein